MPVSETLCYPKSEFVANILNIISYAESVTFYSVSVSISHLLALARAAITFNASMAVRENSLIPIAKKVLPGGAVYVVCQYDFLRCTMLLIESTVVRQPW